MAKRMDLSTLQQRLAALQDADDACVLAAEIGDVREDCNGDMAERFLAGWTNAMDMRDEGNPEVETDKGFLHYCLCEVHNLGDDRE